MDNNRETVLENEAWLAQHKPIAARRDMLYREGQ
jgi:hypothetical protein